MFNTASGPAGPSGTQQPDANGMFADVFDEVRTGQSLHTTKAPY